MKKLALVLVLLGAALAVWLLLANRQHPVSVARESQATQDAAVATALSHASPAATAAIETSFAGVTNTQAIAPGTRPTNAFIPASARQVFAPEITSLTPLAVVENVRTAIHNYGQRFGGNPVGNNAEITRALGGENPGQVNYLDAEAGLRVNEKGEMIDAWGTPFFFHQLSGTVMEIHSAGPDKILWTADDLVTQ
jgi:hypothetical protein